MPLWLGHWNYIGRQQYGNVSKRKSHFKGKVNWLFHYGIANLGLMVLYHGISHSTQYVALYLWNNKDTKSCVDTQKSYFCHIFITCSILHFRLGFCCHFQSNFYPSPELPPHSNYYTLIIALFKRMCLMFSYLWLSWEKAVFLKDISCQEGHIYS